MGRPSARVVILLAAGQSRRFGADKRQHSLGTGSTLLSATLNLYQQHCDAVMLVLRPGDQALAKRLQGEIYGPGSLHTVYATDAELGMGHSLASGANALLELLAQGKTHCQHFFVALADMPNIAPQTLAKLLSVAAATTPGPTIFQPSYRQHPGNPVLFATEHLSALTKLSGDQGARLLIKQNPQERLLVEVDDPGILQDIDRPSDLAPNAC